jgi:hypothetical protein
VRYTVFDGIGFIEERVPKAKVLGPIDVQVGGAFSHAQLRTLDDVKCAMVPLVRAQGGNAVVSFTYGQKSVGFWMSLFRLDDVCWYGRGEIAVVTDKDLA